MHFFSSKTIFYYLFIWFILKFPLDCLALGLCVAWVCYSAMQPVLDDGWPQSRTERSSELEVTHQGFFSVWVSQNHFMLNWKRFSEESLRVTESRGVCVLWVCVTSAAPLQALSARSASPEASERLSDSAALSSAAGRGQPNSGAPTGDGTTFLVPLSGFLCVLTALPGAQQQRSERERRSAWAFYHSSMNTPHAFLFSIGTQAFYGSWNNICSFVCLAKMNL